MSGNIRKSRRFGMREIVNMDSGWKFHDGDIRVTSQGCAFWSDIDRPHLMKAGNHGISKCGYDESGWADVDLPHDFVSWRGDFVPGEELYRGSLRTGIVWYRKSFELQEQDEGRHLWIEFDGIFRDSDV